MSWLCYFSKKVFTIYDDFIETSIAPTLVSLITLIPYPSPFLTIQLEVTYI